ncbi:MAG TPA: hypothetical protein VFP37_19150 [Steroidobacteraceae bacterium]|nr:hypothetical protein [Steroidobacteraceae bacterium]
MNSRTTSKHAATWILALTCLPLAANACSCRRESLKAVYDRSARVFLAEVVKVKRTRARPRHDDTVVYKAVLKPKRAFKGRNPGTFTIKYEVLANPVMVDGVETLVVGGCYLHLEAGDEYVVMHNPGESLDWPDWCSGNFLSSSRIEMDALENLR